MYTYENNVMSAQLLEMSLIGVGTVLRLERDVRSTAKRLRQATNESCAGRVGNGQMTKARNK